MALDAFHICAAQLDSEANILDGAVWQHHLRSPVESTTIDQRRPSSPPFTGSSSLIPRLANHNINKLHSYRSDRSMAAKALSMRHRFVKATALSDPSFDSTKNNPTPQATSDQAAAQQSAIEPSETFTAPSTSLTTAQISMHTFAELYSQLTQNMPTPVLLPQSPSQGSSLGPLSCSTSTSTKSSSQHQTKRNPHHAHRHRHKSGARHRSEWFISKAVNKMRQSQLTNPSLTSASADANDVTTKENVIQPSHAQLHRRCCPRCGDSLPPNATPEYMANHRQSIGHRLGLNAPVSSASASEAPSPTSSESPTPLPRSRSSSPWPVQLSDASTQLPPQLSSKLPRRLRNAPRWKKISRDNVGHSLLSRMGWKEGMGLGVQECKWQQLCHDKVKRQRSEAVRALLLRRVYAIQSAPTAIDSQTSALATGTLPLNSAQPEQMVKLDGRTTTASEEPEWLQMLLHQSTTATSDQHLPLLSAFPFQLPSEMIDQQREAAQTWLSNLAQPDAAWFECLTMEERTSLEQALLSGQVTLEEIQNALWIDPRCLQSQPTGSADWQQASSASTSANAAFASKDDAMQSNALLEPVEVELCSDRRGIGSNRADDGMEASGGKKRRSRTAEGTIEIRRQASPSSDLIDGEHKKPRPELTSRPFGSFNRSRSRSGTANSRHINSHASLTRRQRELAYEQDKRDWLDLRASLS